MLKFFFSFLRCSSLALLLSAFSVAVQFNLVLPLFKLALVLLLWMSWWLVREGSKWGFGKFGALVIDLILFWQILLVFF